MGGAETIRSSVNLAESVPMARGLIATTMNPFFLAAVLALFAITLPAADAPRPNLVFFLIDDLGYADCGFNGGKEIRTPQIDALAEGGAVLEAHYVQPVCSPTRAAFLSGRYPTRTGVYTVVRPHAKWGLPLDERTLAVALKEAGYTTAITGKWHLGEFDPAYLPMSRGFEHQYGHYFGALDYFSHVRDNELDWYREQVLSKEEGYSTHLIAKEACRLIEGQERGKPLFLYVPFNGVHSPLQVPDSYLAPYASLSGSRLQLAGMLAAVDEAVGQIVAALEKAGMRENTLIVFSSDNGGPKPGTNTPLRDYKGSLYEGGVRAAAFANWPGKIPAGQRIAHPMHIIDWYPTLVKLAGASLEGSRPLDGKDVWPMLTEQAPSPHEFLLSAQAPDRAALRIGDWKLIENRSASAAKAKGKAKGKNNGKAAKESEPLALYDLAKDPGETTNLAGSELDRVATMRAKLDELLKDAVPSGQDAAQ
jgi:arylsulfatase A-like enzyme